MVGPNRDRGSTAVSRRWAGAAGALVAVIGVGTLGYALFGFGLLDSLYQTVTTITTVGFREVQPFGTGEKLFTIGLVLAGTGAALTTLGIVFTDVLEGRIGDLMGRRRMDRAIDAMTGHVVLCGWGRVGKAICTELCRSGRAVVVVDLDASRFADDRPEHYVSGDATSDDVLRLAGVERAATLVAALATDADNLFVTLSGKALNPGLFVVARARDVASVTKLERAGADRVVNPQEIGGARMAAFVLQPNVAEFLDNVMHDRDVEFRLREFSVAPGSQLEGRTLRDSAIRDRTGALVLALRDLDGTTKKKPDPDVALACGQVVIAIGTADELAALAGLAAPP